MVTLKPHRRPEQRSLLAACATSSPKQTALAQRPRAVAPARLGGRPGISAEVLSDLHAADAPDRDHHAYDPDRLLPKHATVRTVSTGRALYDALDALDQLPAQRHTLDEDGFQLATNIAAVQTYLALRPELADAHEIRMLLAPIVAQLKGVEL